MKKKVLIPLVCVLIVSFALFFGFNLITEPTAAQGASTMEQFQAELEKIAKEMEALKAQMKETQAERQGVIAEIADLELQIEQKERERTSAENHVIVVEYELQVMGDRIAATEERLAERQELFKERLVSIYTTGEITLIDVLFASSSFKEFITNYDMLERVLAQDQELLKSIQADINDLRIDKKNLEQTKADWQTLNQQIQADIDELEELRAQTEAKRNALSADINELGKMEDAMEADAIRLEAEIAELQRLSTLVNEGVYSWPLPKKNNYVTSDYEMRTHPTKKVWKMHTGIDLRAAKNTEIYAAASGEVILAQYYGSYGNCVIIDHGDSISTLYGHMNKIACKVGDMVERGEVIGYVGTTGASTGYHLHFEVREKGKHVSPWDYVKKP